MSSDVSAPTFVPFTDADKVCTPSERSLRPRLARSAAIVIDGLQNDRFCALCGDDGDLILCDGVCERCGCHLDLCLRARACVHVRRACMLSVLAGAGLHARMSGRAIRREYESPCARRSRYSLGLRGFLLGENK